MAKLSYRRKKKLPRSAFAIPGERKYPIVDKAHARNALARVARFGTAAQKAQVCRAVHRKFPSIRARSCSIAPTGSHRSTRRCRTKTGRFTRCR
jgi:hypothetical protein